MMPLMSAQGVTSKDGFQALMPTGAMGRLKILHGEVETHSYYHMAGGQMISTNAIDANTMN